ncbi:MAG: ABC transporter permease [Candidatus Woesearchaeota archaeon]
MLGIVIGITAIISLITVSQGLENFVTEQFEKIGTDRLYVMPAMFGLDLGEGLTTDDVDLIKKQPEVEWINPFLMTSTEMTFGNEDGFIQYAGGVETDDLEKKFEDLDVTAAKGRFFKNGEKGVVMLGHKIAYDFFDKEVRVNNQVEVKGKKLRVIGILSEIGNSEDDSAVYFAMEDARELFNKPDEISAIEIKVKPGVDITFFADKLSKKLEKARDDDFFSVLTPEQLLEQFGSILNIIQVILGSIAAISLVVGGIGIMNSMYTSVLERTRDIGIMKSIGAKNSAILMVFLTESAILGLIGGIVGIIIGSGFALIIDAGAKQAGYAVLSISIDPKVVLGGLLFAIIIGSISGALPAHRASKLKPVEALRFD